MKILSGVVGVIGVIAIYMVVKNNVVPKNIGVENGELTKMPNKPNAVSSQTDEEDKKVEALEFIVNLEDSKERYNKLSEFYYK